MRRTLPLVLTFVIGLIMVGEYFIPHYGYREVTRELLEWGAVLAAAAYLLGIANLVQVNLPKIANREKDWPYKLLMVVALAITLGVGLLAGDPNGEAGGAFQQQMGAISSWIYDYIFTPLNSTMFALLAFYIASAAFRAFRARNLEATILLVAAVVVMIARVPIGESIPLIGDDLPHLMNWIMDVPNIAARRAIFIGAALGAVTTGLRVILGIERSHLGGD